jgi:transposase
MLLGMTDSINDLPDDIEQLKAMLVAERSEKARLANHNERLLHMLRQLRRNHFGRKSERLSEDQLNLGLEDLETAIASGEASVEKADATLSASRTRQRRVNRGHLPPHLPREETVIEPQAKTCPCCGGDLHVIGEDRSERLDKIPAKFRVIVTRRPKYACRTCERTGADDTAGIIQAPAPPRLIEGGLPTEALVADIVVSKYAWHLPLYRQAQMIAAEGMAIDRSTLAHWVGFAAFELMPVYDRLVAYLKSSSKLFADETRCPVLDPGRGKTKTGYLWALARDDRPWGGTDPPAVAYMYAPGRGGEHALRHLAGFSGTLQVDGYVAYKQLTDPKRWGGPLVLAHCWSHFRRQFYDIAKGGNAPIASEARLRRAPVHQKDGRRHGSRSGLFRHYLVQDYLLLMELGRAYALSVYKSPSLADMHEGAEGLSAILDVEMGLHVKLCAGWGLSPSISSELTAIFRMQPCSKPTSGKWVGELAMVRERLEVPAAPHSKKIWAATGHRLKGLENLGIIVLSFIHPRRDRPHHHGLGWERYEHIARVGFNGKLQAARSRACGCGCQPPARWRWS